MAHKTRFLNRFAATLALAIGVLWPSACGSAEPAPPPDTPAVEPAAPAAVQTSAVEPLPDTVAAVAAEEPPEPTVESGSEPEPEQMERRILVSLEKRRLWLVEGRDTLLGAAVAIGMSRDFTYGGRRYHFATPKGTRRVIAKVKDPVWVVPEWHYYEKAVAMGIDSVVTLPEDARIVLGDSSVLEVRDDQVGRINHFGNFAPFTPGTEIIFDHTMFVPPMTTVQRKVPNALGPYKLDTGDGYLIHGTHLYNEDSIGEAVSHGCVRMTNEDLIRLFPMVPRGTPVIIF